MPSDHPEAPTLKNRAYHNVTNILESEKQLQWEFGGDSLDDAPPSGEG